MNDKIFCSYKAQLENYPIQPKILWKGSLSAEQVSVKIILESNRKTNPEIEAELKRKWAKDSAFALQNNIELYDGISYRLEHYEFQNQKLEITVSPLRYSIRNSLKRLPQLAELGESYYSQGLSVGGFVVTTDDKFIFARKSAHSASTVKTDIVGGVLEEIEPVSGAGILNLNKKEIYEELNLVAAFIESMKIIGLVRSNTTDVMIITATKLNIPSAKLVELFNSRADFELDAIDIVNAQELTSYLRRLGGYKPLIIELLKYL